ncbi:EP32 [Hyphantria cunea nucleopolyhedrovirus]|uniref:EP32 n=1 Tax=Hyphantria cunea nuclear polyhedrosis virus TaxID=28288 RepID=Q59J94_NPVHC|nr:EP32 [Hyphantria cunea nucleopolyhedrovirus]BAD91567.1 early protein 32 [Hyphantria cunea nucleopolyhedrovirus]BAE72297.1 EP32 [Hyphantria cunea nucleopolyhedrovirus]
MKNQQQLSAQQQRAANSARRLTIKKQRADMVKKLSDSMSAWLATAPTRPSYPLVFLNSMHNTTAGANVQFKPVTVQTAHIRIPITATVRFTVATHCRCMHGNIDCHKFACNPKCKADLETGNTDINNAFYKLQEDAEKLGVTIEQLQQQQDKEIDQYFSADNNSCNLSIFKIDNLFKQKEYNGFNDRRRRTACALNNQNIDVLKYKEDFDDDDTQTNISLKMLSVTSTGNFNILFPETNNASWKKLASNNLITVYDNQQETPVIQTFNKSVEPFVCVALKQIRQIIMSQLYQRVEINVNNAMATFNFDMLIN